MNNPIINELIQIIKLIILYLELIKVLHKVIKIKTSPTIAKYVANLPTSWCVRQNATFNDWKTKIKNMIIEFLLKYFLIIFISN